MKRAITSTWHQKAVAVTGILGSGKSSVCKILAAHGAYLLDADQIARDICKIGEPGHRAIAEVFGDSIVTSSGEIDRREVGRLVFSDSTLKSELESKLHPLIAQEAAMLAKKCPDTKFLVYDCPLFFEAKLDKLNFKSVVVVSAPLETCLKRAQNRLGISRSEAQRRIDNQIPLEKKIAQADYHVENSGNLDELEGIVMTLLPKLKG